MAMQKTTIIDTVDKESWKGLLTDESCTNVYRRLMECMHVTFY